MREGGGGGVAVVVVGDVVRGGVASSLVTWYAEGGIVIGDVARERVEVALSSFM